MGRIRIKDKRAGVAGRRNKPWDCIGKARLTINKMENARGVYCVIASDETVEKMLTEDVKIIMKTADFEVQTPPEIKAKKNNCHYKHG